MGFESTKVVPPNELSVFCIAMFLSLSSRFCSSVFRVRSDVQVSSVCAPASKVLWQKKIPLTHNSLDIKLRFGILREEADKLWCEGGHILLKDLCQVGYLSLKKEVFLAASKNSFVLEIFIIVNSNLGTLKK